MLGLQFTMQITMSWTECETSVNNLGLLVYLLFVVELVNDQRVDLYCFAAVAVAGDDELTSLLVVTQSRWLLH